MHVACNKIKFLVFTHNDMTRKEMASITCIRREQSVLKFMHVTTHVLIFYTLYFMLFDYGSTGETHS